MTYEESKAFCHRQMKLWEAEMHGLIAAWSPICLEYFKKDAELQARFALGWRRGRDQMAIEAAMKEHHEERETNP